MRAGQLRGCPAPLGNEAEDIRAGAQSALSNHRGVLDFAKSSGVAGYCGI